VPSRQDLDHFRAKSPPLIGAAPWRTGLIWAASRLFGSAALSAMILAGCAAAAGGAVHAEHYKPLTKIYFN